MIPLTEFYSQIHSIESVSVMAEINTFIFMDLESTGLPLYGNCIKATEICMISVSRKNMMKCRSEDYIPRILNKLSFVINPRAMIPDEVVDKVGLSNETLEDEPYFDENRAQLVKLFLQNCAPPVCLIAHNGTKFDFPLLKKTLRNFEQIISPDVLCADSLLGMRNLSSAAESGDKFSPIISKTDVMLCNELERIENIFSTCGGGISSCSGDTNGRQEVNETTPTALSNVSSFSNGISLACGKTVPNAANNAKRKLFTDDNEEPSWKMKTSYTLDSIYYSLFNRPINMVHRAEGDTLALLQICVKIGPSILEFFDRTANYFDLITAFR